MNLAGLLLVILISPSVTVGQLYILSVFQCLNLYDGTCRTQCDPDNELSVFPFTCYLYGTTYQRCVTSIPCCYYYGSSCQSSCGGDQVALSSLVTCTAAEQVCCIPSSLVTSQTPVASTTTAAETTSTTSTTTPTTTTTPSVATRQGACGSSATATTTTTGQPDARIIGGTASNVTSWPWMIRISYTTTFGFCAGVLVDSDTVVTAAHCVDGVNENAMQVILGDNDLFTFDNEQVVGVASYYTDGDFSRGTRGNDFAVIKLSENVTFTDQALPACLFDPTIPLAVPPSCYIAGWGFWEQGIGGPLREDSVQLLDRTTCAERLAAAGEGALPENITCIDNSAAAPSDGCLYDDGGMLVCLDTQSRWSVVGVMSEYSCGRGLPVLFTDLTAYTETILQQL